MIPSLQRPRRRWIAAGLALAVAVVVGVAAVWPGRDLWPPRLVIPGPKPGEGMPWGYTPDGRWFQTTGEAGLTLWDGTTGQRGPTTSPPFIWRKQTSGDGKRFVGWVGDDFGAAEVVVGTVATGTIDQRFPVQAVQGTNLAFREGDRSIAVVLGSRQETMSVAMWDLATGAESRRTVLGPGKDYTRPVAYSPDGRIWAYLDLIRDGIQLWDSTTDRPIGRLLRNPTTTRDLATWRWTNALFTPDNRTLITGRSDGQVEFWDVATGRLVKLVRLHPGEYTSMSVQLAPDGRTLLSTGCILRSSSRLRQEWERLYYRISGDEPAEASLETILLDLASDQILARARRTRGFGFSPDGQTIVTYDPGGSIAFRPMPRLPDRPADESSRVIPQDHD